MKKRLMAITMATVITAVSLGGCKEKTATWTVTCPWAPSGVAAMVNQKAAALSTEYSDGIILVADAIKGDAATVNTWVGGTEAKDHELVFVNEGLFSITSILDPAKLQFAYDDFVYIENLYSAVFVMSADAECVSNEAHADGYYKEVKKFLKSIPKCTAVVCCNYMILQAVLHAIRVMGKTVPDDYSLVCFDYSKDDWEGTGITCSVHPGYEMGQQVGQRLMQMIEKQEYEGNCYSYVFEPRIYEGRSIRYLET